jgi:hypothetical protein
LSDPLKNSSNSTLEKTALNMLKQKLNTELITSVTGLSSEDILKLKNIYGPPDNARKK